MGLRVEGWVGWWGIGLQPADMNWDVKGKKGREVKDERQGMRKRIRVVIGNVRIWKVSVTLREESQRLMI